MPNIKKEILNGAHFKYNEDDDDEVNISQESDETRSTYLRGWKSCNKSSSKTCQKACRKAIKSICYDYQCSKSFKKDVKKQCKKRCEEKFSYYDYFNVGPFRYLSKPGTAGTYYNQIN